MVEKIYRLQCECGNEIAEGKTRLECLKNARDAELVVREDKAFCCRYTCVETFKKLYGKYPKEFR